MAGNLACIGKRSRTLQNGARSYGCTQPRGETEPNPPDSQSRTLSESIQPTGWPIPAVL